MKAARLLFVPSIWHSEVYRLQNMELNQSRITAVMQLLASYQAENHSPSNLETQQPGGRPNIILRNSKPTVMNIKVLMTCTVSPPFSHHITEQFLDNRYPHHYTDVLQGPTAVFKGDQNHTAMYPRTPITRL